MPLPDEHTPWPPEDDEPARALMAVHDAWYSGQVERIERVHGVERPRVRPSQLAGGLLGWLARAWYGKPALSGYRDRLHSGTPGDLAAAAAELLFAEPVQLVAEDQGVQDRLDWLVQVTQLRAQLVEAAETAAALGGAFLRVWWDDALAGHPLVQVVHPDQAWPTVVAGRLRSVRFVHVVEDDGVTVWRHVEQHEPDGTVLHGLYRGSSASLGQRRNLDDHPATRGLQDVVPPPLPGVLSVVYVPNMRPHPVLRGSWLGRSDYTRNEPLFDWLDETVTSWRRDIRLAKARLIVPSGYLTNLGPGKGAAFDLDREVYEEINAPPMSGQNASPITLAQFAIRVEEHRGTVREILRRIVSNAGYSEATFGLDEAGQAATATEIKERFRRSLIRRDRQITYWTPALTQLAAVLLAVDRRYGGPGPTEVVVDWPDGVAEDMLSLAQTASLLRTAEAASTETIVRVVHPDWDDARVQQEVAAIQGERAARDALLPDPLDQVPA